MQSTVPAQLSWRCRHTAKDENWKLMTKIEWQRSDMFEYVKQQMTFLRFDEFRSLSICFMTNPWTSPYVNECVWQSIKYMHGTAQRNIFWFSSRSLKTICWPLFNGNDHWMAYLIRFIRIWALGNEIFYLSLMYLLLKFWIFGFIFTTNKCQTQVNGCWIEIRFGMFAKVIHTHTHTLSETHSDEV